MGKTILISLLATVAFCAILAAPAAAFKSSTGGYNLYISNLGYGAHNNYTGENYTLDFSLVEQPVANATSSNYSAYLGFYSAVLYLPPTGPFDIIVDAPYSVSPSDVISAAVYLINRHPTTGGDYVVSYWIRDMAGNIAAGPSQTTVMVPARSTAVISASLDTPVVPGTYYFWARVSWSGSYAEASDPFITFAPSQGGTGGGGPIGGGGGIVLPPANQTNVTGVTNVTNATQTIIIENNQGILQIVKQPMEINITECGVHERLFYFMNRGNGSIANVSLFISGLSLDYYTIEPSVHEKIEPNEVAAFKFTLIKLPRAGEYTLNFIVTSASGTDAMPGRMTVEASAGQCGGQTPILTAYAFILAAIIAVLLILIGSFVLRRRGSRAVDRNLVYYIEKHMADGYSPGALRRILLNEGWKEREIDDAMSIVKSDKRNKRDKAKDKLSEGSGRIEPIE